jgi:hypothetical protein
MMIYLSAQPCGEIPLGGRKSDGGQLWHGAVYMLFAVVTKWRPAVAFEGNERTAYGTTRRTVAVLDARRADWSALVASASEP